VRRLEKVRDRTGGMLLERERVDDDGDWHDDDE
jgi:hypothetical protein